MAINPKLIEAYFRRQIEDGDFDPADTPQRIARYGAMEPQDFMNEMEERLSDSDAGEEIEFAYALADAGMEEAQAWDVAEQLIAKATAHHEACAEALRQGDESALQEIESLITREFDGLPGIKGFAFLRDPRGSTVGVNLASGASNSLTGGYKVPILPTEE